MNKQKDKKRAMIDKSTTQLANKTTWTVLFVVLLLGVTAVTAVIAQSLNPTLQPQETIEIFCNGRGIEVERLSQTQLNLICQPDNRQPDPTPTLLPPVDDVTPVPPSPPIAEGTYYVAPNGSNQNAGTINQPFKTIQHAVDLARAGDVILVRGGVYHETVTVRSSGTAERPITLAAYPGETPVIDGAYTLPAGSWSGCNDSVSPPKCYHYGPLLHVQGNHVIIDGFEITRSLGRGLLVNRPNARVSNVTIRNNQIHDNRNAAIKIIEADHVLVEGNSVWHSGDYATNDRSGSPGGDTFNPNLGWPIAVSDRRASHVTYRGNHVFENWSEGIGADVDSTQIVIEDNVLYDNRALQIYVHRAQNVIVQRNLAYCTNNPLFWRGGNPPPGIVLNNESQFSNNQTTENVEIVNNIVAGCRQNLAFWGSNQYTVRNVLVAHNTLVNAYTNTGQQDAIGLSLSNGNTYQNVRIINNLVYQPNGRVASGSSAAGLSFANNLWSQTPPTAVQGAGDIVGNPSLGNPNAPLAAGAVRPEWYKLQSGSIAVDQASRSGAVTHDFFGAARASQPDIGAHELMP